MKELKFSTTINAPREKVWNILWNDASYREWTKHFTPGSYMESDWKEGGKTLFLDPERNGMVSTIKQLEVPHSVVFSHIGEVVKGVEDTTSERVQAYSGAEEKYELTEDNGITTLTASIETIPDYEQMMNDGFTKGLETVKQLAENNAS